MIAISPRSRLSKAALFWPAILLVTSVLAAAHINMPKVTAEVKPKVIIVTTNGFGAGEIAKSDSKVFKRLTQEGAAGLMNIRTQASPNAYDGYLCLGAGVKTKTGGMAGESFMASEKLAVGSSAGETFFMRTGVLPPEGSIVTLPIASIALASKDVLRSNRPGALGSALKGAALKAAVLGNADLEEGHYREAALITMDELGLTYLGDVSNATNTVKEGLGTVTDYELLIEKTRALYKASDLLVVELGDTTRLENKNDLFTEAAIEKRRAYKMKGINRYLDELVGFLDEGTTLFVLSPSNPADSMAKGNLLAPIFIYGRRVDGGTVISDTTRWPGIIDSTDIAPTVLSLLGLEAAEGMTGRPIRYEKKALSPLELDEMSLRYENKAVVRAPVLKGYVTLVSIMVILVAAAIFFKMIPKKLSAFLQAAFLWLLSIPVAFELFAPIDYGHMIIPILAVSAISAIIVFVAHHLKRAQLMPIAFVCLSTAFVLMIDISTGWNLIRTSILGYCPNIGARFYGIGNEYMGILIGSSIVGITSILDILGERSKKGYLFVAALFALIIAMIGHPALGANVGGTIASSVGFGVTLIILFKGGLKRGDLLYVAAAVVAIVGLFLAIDVFRSGAASHAGRSLISIYRGGTRELIDIVQRKLAMNYRGMKYTVWTRILLATLLAAPMLFFRPVGFFNRLKIEHPSLVAGFIGTSLGALAAFIFNDTGAAAAAATIMFAIVALLYIIVEEELPTP